MSDKSKIEWTDATWNVVRGCSLVSEGCRNCYAMRQAHRASGRGRAYEGLTRLGNHGPVWTGDVRLVPDLLDQPLRWRRPRRVFVNAMSDLFHEGLGFDDIVRVWLVMLQAEQHTFQVLTKRADRMRAFLEHVRLHGPHYTKPNPRTWTPPNVWLGVSVENQETADERIPLLVKTPAAIRFLSCEPLLGPINLNVANIRNPDPIGWPTEYVPPLALIDWLIVGGESGPGARPMHPDWARSLRDQSLGAGVAFHFKQWGAWAPASFVKDWWPRHRSQIFHWVDNGDRSFRVGKKAAGRELDGREWNEYPIEAQG